MCFAAGHSQYDFFVLLHPAVTLASDKISTLSGDATLRSGATGLPSDQLGIRTSAGLNLYFSDPHPLPILPGK